MNKWPKSITVDKRIVKILSQSTYENFPNALKEIITNSYDADASLVDISIDKNRETVSIEDNGWGMNEEDFDLYLKIAGLRRTKKEITPSGRRIIGQFGIGFLATFPFFLNFYIESKRAGTPEILFAEIPCYKYFSNSNITIGDIEIIGGTRYDNTLLKTQFTKIKLSGFTKLTQTFFYPKRDSKPRKNSIQKFKPYDKLLWQLKEDLPIKYEKEKFNFVFKLFSPNLKFDVIVNDVMILRKVHGGTILESSFKKPIKIGNIKLHYFIVTDKKSVAPYEARYLKLRNLNVGVGERTTFGLGTEVGGARSRLQWLSGEIIFIDGMNDLISVSRDNFNYSSDYESLKEFFIQKLSHYSNKLEEESKVISHFIENVTNSKLQDIRLLDPAYVERKIVELNDIGININEEQYIKKIKFRNNEYELKLDKWDYLNETLPACKIYKDKIIVNKEYPLFSKTKYTDVFLKFHIILLFNLNEGHIEEKNYKKINQDIINYFKDYS